MSIKKTKQFAKDLGKCYSRCNSWFSLNKPELIDPCKSACYNDVSLTRDAFLCSGNYVNEFDFINKYKHDPCPNSGYTYEQVMRELGLSEPQIPPASLPSSSNPDNIEVLNNEVGLGNPNLKWLWIGGGIVLGLIALYFLFVKK